MRYGPARNERCIICLGFHNRQDWLVSLPVRFGLPDIIEHCGVVFRRVQGQTAGGYPIYCACGTLKKGE